MNTETDPYTKDRAARLEMELGLCRAQYRSLKTELVQVTETNTALRDDNRALRQQVVDTS